MSDIALEPVVGPTSQRTIVVLVETEARKRVLAQTGG